MFRLFAIPAAIAIAGAMLLPSAVMAQPVVVDDFTVAHVVNADSNNPTATGVVTDASILGSERDIRVEFINGGAGQQTTSNAGAGTLGHGETDNSQGRTILTWDGVDGSRDGAILDGSNNVTGGGIATTGLGGIDVASACPSPEPGFYIGASRSDNGNDYSVTVNVYSSNTQWSSLTRTKTGGDPAVMLAFAFADFLPQGNGGTQGADFTNVGAVELIINVTGVGTDLSVFTPLAGCEYDFGDAPEFQSAGGGIRLYSTTLAIKNDRNPATGAPNNVERGPHALINGSWFPTFSTPLGSVGSNDTDGELNGQRSVGADGDDILLNNDESGVDLPPMPRGDTSIDPNLGPVACDGLDMGPSEYCAAVRVANPSDSDAQVAGWIDFDSDGIFEIDGCSGGDGIVSSGTTGDGLTTLGTQGCERAAAQVRIGDTGLGDMGGTCSASSLNADDTLGGTDFTTGNLPNNCEGIVILVWDLSATDVVTENETYSRFRITSDTARGNFFNNSPGPEPFGFQGNGEIEDHVLVAGTLPVSIHSFDSRYVDDGLLIEWGTVSETRSAGFHVWADFGKGVELVNERQIPSTSTDVAKPERYQFLIPDVADGDVVSVAITGVDYESDEEVYGLFSPGLSYGAKSNPVPLAWDSIGMAVERRLQARSAHVGKSSASKWSRSTAGTIDFVDLRPSESGIQSISGQELADAGLDITGVDTSSIAVTLKGVPVARHVVTETGYGAFRRARGSSSFGADSEIRFWAEKPVLPDALYLDDYVYRVTVDRSLAVPANELQTKPKPGVSSHMEWLRQDHDERYDFASSLQDPWYAAELRADSSNSEYETSFTIDDDFIGSDSASLKLVIGGLTNASASPNHHVRIMLNGEILGDEFFTGAVERKFEFLIPEGVLQPGANSVRISAPGGTDASIDMMLVDKVELGYVRRASARNDRLLVESAGRDGGLTVTGLRSLDTVAYGWTDGDVTALPREQFSRGSVRIPTLIEGANYWISTREAMHRPAVVGSGSRLDLLDGVDADFLVVAHPAFMPLDSTEMHPLNDFLQQREADGWQPVLFDITEIQAQYGHGMALPDALTAFLAEADQRMAYEHVLLVGGDSYDYTNNLDLGSISFIPTRYAPTRFIRHTPSDALLGDIDGDGVSDKAIGRWPVRTFGDLQAIVSKTLTWDGSASSLQNAVWVADSDQAGEPAFTAQADRMASPLLDAGWAQTAIDRVYFDDVDPAPGLSIADTARRQFFDLLEQGRALTGFVGHGAPAMWTFQGLLTPDDLSDLHNEGAPTLIGTMTCYTSYFVSPVNDSVAHRWMNGYREDASGVRVEGIPNGSVAIHGAATLSNYAQNETFAKRVLVRQLEGETLGQAVQGARETAADRLINDLVINWTLLGDPTLRIQ